MRVIWVTPSLPHPRDVGGSSHEFQLLAALAGHHDITVLSTEHHTPLGAGPLEAAGIEVRRVSWTPRPYPTAKPLIAFRLVRADPNLILWTRHDRIVRTSEALEDELERDDVDLVHVTLGELAPVIEVATRRGVPTSLLLFDSLTREIEVRLRAEALVRRRAQLRLERARTRRFEARWYARASAVAAVSSADAEWFGDLLGTKVPVIENPIADEFVAPAEPRFTDGRVTFVGSFAHQPNSDAISWLCAEIWPLVVSSRPDAELLVVGRGDRAGTHTARMRALVEAAGGRLEADVDDIVSWYHDAAVAVAPVRLGAGLKNKVLHAMACGTPVVATPVALEGVPQRAAAAARCASDAGDFARLIVEVLDDPAAARREAGEAFTAMDELRTSRIAERFDTWWSSAVAASAG